MSAPFDQSLYSQIINRRGPDNVPESYAEGWRDAADIAAQIAAERQATVPPTHEEWSDAELVKLYESIVNPPRTIELLLPEEWTERKAEAMAAVRQALNAAIECDRSVAIAIAVDEARQQWHTGEALGAWPQVPEGWVFCGHSVYFDEIGRVEYESILGLYPCPDSKDEKNYRVGTGATWQEALQSAIDQIGGAE